MYVLFLLGADEVQKAKFFHALLHRAFFRYSEAYCAKAQRGIYCDGGDRGYPSQKD